MSHRISLQPAGRSFTVEDDEAILAAAIRQGIGMPYGCRDGACGSCKSRLLEGRVEQGPHQLKALSEAEKQAGLILTCCARALTDCAIEARMVPGAGEHPVQKMPTRVLSIERAAEDVAIVRLQLPANQNFQFFAGQYLEFILKDGARRSYSMASAPSRLGSPPAVELHIRRMPGGLFTEQVFTTLKERDILRAEGPFGSFFLREESRKPIILLASGTGFAPIQAILQHMQDKGLTRPTTLYWGCRRRADLYRHAWCEEQAAALPWLRYVPVLSEAAPEDAWRGRGGFVHEAVMADFPDLAAHEVYACGTPAMVQAAERDFVARCGLPPEAFYADAFTSEADKHGAMAR
ncbi:MAG TPA: CDP-6-deoxy-delta-3,4-glucoseen reductase [Rubrivivax sp.]|nr:CDP-6-deoxy-delta-3,4-glucoseen reductase [Rubrivivax sp.]